MQKANYNNMLNNTIMLVNVGWFQSDDLTNNLIHAFQKWPRIYLNEGAGTQTEIFLSCLASILAILYLKKKKNKDKKCDVQYY